MKIKTDDMIVIGLAGAAVVLIAKAAGLKLPSLNFGSAQTFAQSVWNPLKPVPGTSYDPVDPGAFIWNNDLINGTINDLAYNYPATTIPTIGDIFSDVTGRSVIRTGTPW